MQDISIFEEKANKVTAWSLITTDVHYPSEKLVKDALDSMPTQVEEQKDVLLQVKKNDDGIFYDTGSTKFKNKLTLQPQNSNQRLFYNSTVVLETNANNINRVCTLSKKPQIASQVVKYSISNNSLGDKFVESYLMATATGLTTITSDVWGFNFFASVNESNAINVLKTNLMRVRIGSGTVTMTGFGNTRTCTSTQNNFTTTLIDASSNPSEASYIQTSSGLYHITERTSDTVVTISVPDAYTNQTAVAFSVWKKLFQGQTENIKNTGANYGLYSCATVQPYFTILASDKIAAIIFSNVSSVFNQTINYVFSGDVSYSHISSAIPHAHDDNGPFNIGDLQHLTAAQRSAMLRGSGDAFNIAFWTDIYTLASRDIFNFNPETERLAVGLRASEALHTIDNYGSSGYRCDGLNSDSEQKPTDNVVVFRDLTGDISYRLLRPKDWTNGRLKIKNLDTSYTVTIRGENIDDSLTEIILYPLEALELFAHVYDGESGSVGAWLILNHYRP